jgi:hypothetical protein
VILTLKDKIKLFNFLLQSHMRSRYCSVCIAPRLRIERPWNRASNPCVGEICVFSDAFGLSLGPVQLRKGNGTSFPGIKLPGHDADHPHPFSAQG